MGLSYNCFMARKLVISSVDTALWAFIARFIRDADITLEDLAVRANLSTQAIRDLSKPGSNPQWETIKSLAAALQTTPDQIALLLDGPNLDRQGSLREASGSYRSFSSAAIASDSAQRLWQAYVSIAQSVAATQLPEDLRPKPADIVEMAKASLKLP